MQRAAKVITLRSTQRIKHLGDGEVLDQRLPDVDLRIAKAIRKTVEAEIRRMRWGKQGFGDVGYGTASHRTTLLRIAAMPLRNFLKTTCGITFENCGRRAKIASI